MKEESQGGCWPPAVGKCPPQTSGPPQSHREWHTHGKGWAGSGCAPWAGKRGQAWAQVGACAMRHAWGSVPQFWDRIRAALAEGTPALQPCPDRLVQPGLGDPLALWKFQGRSSVVSANSRLTQKDGNKLAQTQPDWKWQSFCYGSRLWNTTLSELKGTSHRFHMQMDTLRNVLSGGVGAAAQPGNPGSWQPPLR